MTTMNTLFVQKPFLSDRSNPQEDRKNYLSSLSKETSRQLQFVNSDKNNQSNTDTTHILWVGNIKDIKEIYDEIRTQSQKQKHTRREISNPHQKELPVSCMPTHPIQIDELKEDEVFFKDISQKTMRSIIAHAIPIPNVGELVIASISNLHPMNEYLLNQHIIDKQQFSILKSLIEFIDPDHPNYGRKVGDTEIQDPFLAKHPEKDGINISLIIDFHKYIVHLIFLLTLGKAHTTLDFDVMDRFDPARKDKFIERGEQELQNINNTQDIPFVTHEQDRFSRRRNTVVKGETFKQIDFLFTKEGQTDPQALFKIIHAIYDFITRNPHPTYKDLHERFQYVMNHDPKPMCYIEICFRALYTNNMYKDLPPLENLPSIHLEKEGLLAHQQSEEKMQQRTWVVDKEIAVKILVKEVPPSS